MMKHPFIIFPRGQRPVWFRFLLAFVKSITPKSVKVNHFREKISGKAQKRARRFRTFQLQLFRRRGIIKADEKPAGRVAGFLVRFIVVGKRFYFTSLLPLLQDGDDESQERYRERQHFISRHDQPPLPYRKGSQLRRMHSSIPRSA